MSRYIGSYVGDKVLENQKQAERPPCKISSWLEVPQIEHLEITETIEETMSGQDLHVIVIGAGMRFPPPFAKNCRCGADSRGVLFPGITGLLTCQALKKVN